MHIFYLRLFRAFHKELYYTLVEGLFETSGFVNSLCCSGGWSAVSLTFTSDIFAFSCFPFCVNFINVQLMIRNINHCKNYYNFIFFNCYIILLVLEISVCFYKHSQSILFIISYLFRPKMK